MRFDPIIHKDRLTFIPDAMNSAYKLMFTILVAMTTITAVSCDLLNFFFFSKALISIQIFCVMPRKEPIPILVNIIGLTF